MSVHVCACVSATVSLFMFVFMCVHIISVFSHLCIHEHVLYMCTCVNVRVCVCVRVCVFVCVFVGVCVLPNRVLKAVM